MNGKNTYEIAGLLRTPSEFFESVGDGTDALGPIIFLSALTAAGAAVFGFALGSFAGVTTGFLDALKMAGVILFAYVLTYPSLYVFASICGCRYSALRLAAFGLVSTGVLGCLLAALAPILWIFAVSTETKAFIMVFSVLLAGVALAVAFRPIFHREDKEASFANAGFAVWSVLFVIVALQTVTLLRPMLSSADETATQRSKLFFVQHFIREVCR